MALTKNNPSSAAPSLAAIRELVVQAVEQWPDVVASVRWDPFRAGKVADGTNFHLGDGEIGHLHLNGEANLATSPAMRQALVARGLARPLRWGGDAFPGWTEYRVRTVSDAAHAIWLFELNYQRLQGRPEAELIAAINDRPVATQ